MPEAVDDIVWELSDTSRMWWDWAMQDYYAGRPRKDRRRFGRRLASLLLKREQQKIESEDTDGND